MYVQVYNDAEAVAGAAASAVAGWLTEAAGRVTLGLAGGGTPIATYRRLREEDMRWDSVDAWLGDERWVPRHDPDSNALMAAESLTDHVPAQLLEMDYALGNPAAAAADYDARLRSVIGADRPDVVLLGMGEDGHTASLFPGTSALDEHERLYVANWVDAKESWRLTATLPLLWSARRLAFLVTGAAKAAAIAAVLEQDRRLPAQLVAEGADDVTWFLDAAAASQLQGNH